VGFFRHGRCTRILASHTYNACHPLYSVYWSFENRWSAHRLEVSMLQMSTMDCNPKTPSVSEPLRSLCTIPYDSFTPHQPPLMPSSVWVPVFLKLMDLQFLPAGFLKVVISSFPTQHHLPPFHFQTLICSSCDAPVCSTVLWIFLGFSPAL